MNNREYWRERMRALEEKGYREINKILCSEF